MIFMTDSGDTTVSQNRECMIEAKSCAKLCVYIILQCIASLAIEYTH